jgi:Zn-finger nucleic acid-binding protein
MTALTPDNAVCPRDGAPLVEVERSGVLIDACPTCRGVWLDRGELEKLVAVEGAAASDQDFLSEVTGKRNSIGHQTDKQHETSTVNGGKRRRGSLLQNFLDLGGGE